jgi:LysM repeat protein
LGLLYEQRISEENSYAVAIYHYDRFLQLRPKSDHADVVRQKIISCKQELAKPIALAPGTQSVLRDMERLKVENTQMKSQLEAWAAYATNRQAMATPPAPLVQRTATGQPFVAAPAPGAANPAPIPAVNPAPQARPAARSHKVASNETPATIARRYSISTKALMDANPGVDPKRLKIGQTLNVPN